MTGSNAGPGARSVLTSVPQGSSATDDDSSVVYVSRGAALVFGPAALALPVARDLAATLRVLACVPDAVAASGPGANPAVMIARVARVEGYLGRFAAAAHQGGNALADLGLFSPNNDRMFDLIVDLGSPPLLPAEVGPPGYFAPGADRGRIASAIATAQSLVGTFRKQRYFRYERTLCTHSAKGITGCSRCLDACPAGAIHSKAGLLEVDPWLCQGCATCALVCPTGAMAYAAPRAPVPGAPSRPGVRTLRIRQEDDAPNHGPVPQPDQADWLAVPAIAAAGLADWLGALANGYARVVVQLPREMPSGTRRQLQAQLALARALLPALGQPPEAIAFADGGDAGAIGKAPARQAGAAVAAGAPADAVASRAAILAAIDILERRIDPPPGGAPWPLPAAAPFGTVDVDREMCTLCMACVNLCPTGALGGTEAPKVLNFTESACVQCGLCARGCPEQAIALRPRLLPRRAARNTTRVLNHDKPHHCPQCGVPFIGLALLTRAMQVMRDGAALEDGAIAALKLCPACRAEAMQ